MTAPMAYNRITKKSSGRTGGNARRTKVQPKARISSKKRGAVKLLTGGNPQIAKAEGNAPVQAYIAALSGWKQQTARELDALITRAAPKARKAVKWNSPFYGMPDAGWFASFHVFTRYIKVTFFKGTALTPPPPGGSSKESRWLDVHEGEFDAAQLTRWVKQATKIPGWLP